MLPKYARIPAQQIGRVLREGKRISGRYVDMRYVTNSLSYVRFACIVSNTIDKRAVVRNTIKRYLREAIKIYIGSIDHGIDMVIAVKSKELTNFAKVKLELNDVLMKASLLHNT